MTDLSEMCRVAREVATAYDAKNRMDGRNSWTADNYMAGFVGDVGDLAKLVMAKSGYRDADDLERRIGHELSDCLWSILILSDELGVDLEEAYTATMAELLRKLGAERT